MSRPDDLERALASADPARYEPIDRPEHELRAEAAALIAAAAGERSRRLRRPSLGRFATVAATLLAGTAVALALLLAGGEQDRVPQPLGVLDALADDLQSPGRILHVLERTEMLTDDGRPTGDLIESETWMLLDDVRYERYRVERGGELHEGASTPSGFSRYEREANTFTTTQLGSEYEPGTARRMDELPVERLAKAAASGRVPIEAHVTIDGRPALKIRNDGIVWYLAADQPEILRSEIMPPVGPAQQTDYLVFEILPATPENRRLLEIDPPADARNVSRHEPDQR